MRASTGWWMVVIGCVACGNSGDGGGDAPGRGSDDAVLADGGSGDGAQGGPSTFGGYGGYFRFIQQAHSRPSFGGAMFGTGFEATSCTWTQPSASCYAYTCTAIGSGAEPDAGAITIRGGSAGSGAGIAIDPVGLGVYGHAFADDSVAFAPGDVLSLSATGSGDVPAFSHEITEPPCATFAAPFAGDGATPFTLPAGSDVDVTWTGAAPDAVVFVDVAGYGSGETTTETGLYCQWAADAGAGTLPAAGLAPVASLPTITSGVAQARVSTFAEGSGTLLVTATCQVGAATTFAN